MIINSKKKKKNTYNVYVFFQREKDIWKPEDGEIP